MADENQPSKKRAAGRELSRDNPGLDDEEDVPEQEMGTFKKASDDVLATRKIVKVRRQQTSTTAPSAPSSNPFAGIRLVPPTAPPANVSTEANIAEGTSAVEEADNKDETNTQAQVENKDFEEKTTPTEQSAEVNQPNQVDKADASNTIEKAAEAESTDEKKVDESAEETAEVEHTNVKQDEGDKAKTNDENEDEKPDANGGGGAAVSSFQQLSNTPNAFTGLAGSGFSSSAFSFGFQKDGSPSQSSFPTFNFGTSNNGSSSTSIFGTTLIGNKSEASLFPSKEDVPRETGEENEETVFSSDSSLFEFFDGGWKERGKGEVKVNVLKTDTQKARLVMRAKGNLRLILNASLYPDMKLTKMDKKGVSFACVNTASAEQKDGLSTFGLKFKDGSIVEEFSSAVSEHKGMPSTDQKTPENSPKAPEN